MCLERNPRELTLYVLRSLQPIAFPVPRLLSVMTDVMIEPISGTVHPTMDMSAWLPITDAGEEGDWRDAST